MKYTFTSKKKIIETCSKRVSERNDSEQKLQREVQKKAWGNLNICQVSLSLSGIFIFAKLDYYMQPNRLILYACKFNLFNTL